MKSVPDRQTITKPQDSPDALETCELPGVASAAGAKWESSEYSYTREVGPFVHGLICLENGLHIDVAEHRTGGPRLIARIPLAEGRLPDRQIDGAEGTIRISRPDFGIVRIRVGGAAEAGEPACHEYKVVKEGSFTTVRALTYPKDPDTLSGPELDIAGHSTGFPRFGLRRAELAEFRDSMAERQIPERGLLDREIAREFGEEMSAVFGSWKDLAPRERQAEIEDAINGVLAKAGVPPCSFGNLPEGANARGQFSPSDWQIKYSEKVLERESLSPRLQRQMAQTLYHEARHAEQHFKFGQLMAGRGQDDHDISWKVGLPGEISALCEESPLKEGHKGFGWVKELYEDNYSPQAMKRARIVSEVLGNQKYGALRAIMAFMIYQDAAIETDARQAASVLRKEMGGGLPSWLTFWK